MIQVVAAMIVKAAKPEVISGGIVGIRHRQRHHLFPGGVVCLK